MEILQCEFIDLLQMVLAPSSQAEIHQALLSIVFHLKVAPIEKTKMTDFWDCSKKLLVNFSLHPPTKNWNVTPLLGCFGGRVGICSSKGGNCNLQFPPVLNNLSCAPFCSA